MGSYPIIDADGHVEPAMEVDWFRYMPAHGRQFMEGVRENYKGFAKTQTGRAGGWDPAAPEHAA